MCVFLYRYEFDMRVCVSEYGCEFICVCFVEM